jgi:cysteine desulfurase
MEPIYLDHHATTPCDSSVVQAMLPFFSDDFGNAASRSHGAGFRARTAVEAARRQVAALIGATSKEVVWTSGATESNNLAILGAVRASGHPKRHIITAATEHPAVLDPCKALEREGAHLTVLPVDRHGLVDPDAVAAALRPETVLVSVMLVNNEIGVVQDLEAISAVCRAQGVLVHCDAAQAAAWLSIDVRAMGIDLLSLSAHKMYGPKGVGALYVRRGRPKVDLVPLQYGGGHERGLRSGTLAVPLIVGMGHAAELATAGEVRAASVGALRDALLQGLQEGLAGVHVNGSLSRRAPHNLNLSFDGVEAEALILAVREVLAVSTGSACSSSTLQPSHVLRALGLPPERTASSIRFGLGRSTTAQQIEQTVDHISAAVVRLRSMADLYEV